MAGGWLVAGWLVGYSDIKANSVQLQLPTGTELGNTNIPPSMVRKVTGSLRPQSIHQYIIMIEVLGVT